MVYLSDDDCNRLDSNYDHPSEALSDRGYRNYQDAQRAVDNYDPLHEEYVREMLRYRDELAHYSDYTLEDFEADDQLFNLN